MEIRRRGLLAGILGIAVSPKGALLASASGAAAVGKRLYFGVDLAAGPSWTVLTQGGRILATFHAADEPSDDEVRLAG